MDAKGRPTAADLSELELLASLAEQSSFPLVALAPKFPRKLIIHKLRKLYERNLIDPEGLESDSYGLTNAGRARLLELRKPPVIKSSSS